MGPGLWAVLPMPDYRYRDLEAVVVSCAPASSRLEAAVAEWEKRTAQPRHAGRPGWKEDFARMFAAGGSVLRVRVARGAYSRQWPPELVASALGLQTVAPATP